jgi:hypothetical protein
MHPTLTAALDYARLGYRVIPLKPGSKVPDLRHWPEEASNDPDVVARHFASSLARARAEARRSDEVIVPNVGIVTGNGLAVLDVDKDHGGKRPSWAPDTMTVQTASGGYHFYYAVDRPVPNSVGRLALGVDVRGERGQVAAPPSAIVLPVYHKVAGERVYSTSEYKLVYDRPIAKIEADLLIPEDVRQDFTGRLGRRFEYRDEVPGRVPVRAGRGPGRRAGVGGAGVAAARLLAQAGRGSRRRRLRAPVPRRALGLSHAAGT